MFNAVSQACQNYYDQLPADGLKAIGLSAAVSLFASVTIITMTSPANQVPDLSRAYLAHGISLLAATVHVLTNPIFNYILDNPNNDFNGFHEFLKSFVNITFVHILINNNTAFKVNIITSMNFRDGNFIILPSNIFKAPVDAAIKLVEFTAGHVPTPLVNFFTDVLHMDFKQNSTPFYICA